MQCGNGHPVGGDDKFCRTCGAPVPRSKIGSFEGRVGPEEGLQESTGTEAVAEEEFKRELKFSPLMVAVFVGAVGALAAWGYRQVDNAVLLLLTTWLVTYSFVGFYLFGKFALFSHSRLERATGGRRPVPILFFMTVFSFYAYFAYEPQWRWILLAHGIWWGLIWLYRMIRRRAP